MGVRGATEEEDEAATQPDRNATMIARSSTGNPTKMELFLLTLGPSKHPLSRQCHKFVPLTNI